VSNFAHFIFQPATLKLLKAWIEACFPAIDSALKNAYFLFKKSQDKRRWNLTVLRAKP